MPFPEMNPDSFPYWEKRSSPALSAVFPSGAHLARRKTRLCTSRSPGQDKEGREGERGKGEEEQDVNPVG